MEKSSINIVFSNKGLIKYICFFTREEYSKRMCKNIYKNWLEIPFGYDIGISDKQLMLYKKWAENISKIDEDFVSPVMIGNIKTRNPDYSHKKEGLYPNGMIWCFDGRRLMTLKHREDGIVSWRFP